MSEFARKKAATNTLKIIGSIASILTIAKILDPESVDEDPRSSNFGKILIGDRRKIKIDMTAGMGGIVTLASRIIPTTHRGRWGWWMKNSRGQYTRLGTGEYGVSDPVDQTVSFMEGKAAPIARTFLDYWKGRDYTGQKTNLFSELKQSVTPIAVGNLFDLAKTSAGEEPILFAVLTALDMLGFNISIKQRRK